MAGSPAWCDEAVTPAVGLLLAAGAGRRMGQPKALVRGVDGTPWLTASLAALRDGGCSRLVVVLGAAADEARELLADDPTAVDVEVVVAPDWQEGMGASLRTGLQHLTGATASSTGGAAAAVVSLVDLPDVGASVVRRLLGATTPGEPSAMLARAAYGGIGGHPVLLGAAHWAGVSAVARGDRGARDYLAQHPAVLVECGDLATGADRDTPQPVSHLSPEAPHG